MPTLALTNFNIVCSCLGSFVGLFGLVSFFAKERLYLSEALISLLVGVILGPKVANFLKPSEYAGDNGADLESITLAFCRLVLGVQLVLAGVQLPAKYLLKEWKSLAMLLGPVMTGMWGISSLLIWALVPGLPFLQALAIAACVTPTDPILSNTIVKGKFADKHVPRDLQRIIIAESGANDGLGYPFLFIALYIIKYVYLHDPEIHGGAGKAIGLWFGDTLGYTILLSVVYGGVAGWIAKDLLGWAERRKLVDRESFLVFAIALALFCVGTCGLVGTDDVLAAFIAGNSFSWDDHYRLETLDDSLQPTIDMLLNITIFLWFGAVVPWSDFTNTPNLPIARLIGLVALILLLRRLPMMLACYKYIPRVGNLKEAFFMGFFGPMGVSALFYLFIALEFIEPLAERNQHDEEKVHVLMAALRPVVWMCMLGSVLVHGITVPIIKLGNAIPLPRSFSINNLSGRNSSSSHGRDPGAPLPGLGARIPDSDVQSQSGAQSGSESPSRSRSKSSSPKGTRRSEKEPEERSRRREMISGQLPVLEKYGSEHDLENPGLEEATVKDTRGRRVKIVEDKNKIEGEKESKLDSLGTL